MSAPYTLKIALELDSASFEQLKKQLNMQIKTQKEDEGEEEKRRKEPWWMKYGKIGLAIGAVLTGVELVKKIANIALEFSPLFRQTLKLLSMI
ncbi:MAG: hypothetical protein NZ941_00005, partial [Candidatus Caldarchaeum sp.]|nr:hypothetical protein [Candidatus Caldarchaeum sp.]